MTQTFDDNELDRLLNEAGRDVPEPSAKLLERVLADAYEAGNAFQGNVEYASLAPVSRQGSFWQSLSASLGGWAGFSGLVTSVAAGLWLGYAQPVGMETLLGVDSTEFEIGDFMSDFGTFLLEDAS